MARSATSLGVDLSDHRASALRSGELADASLVVGFEPFHVATAVVDGGAKSAVAFTLPELVSLLEPLRFAKRDVNDIGGQLDEVVASAGARRRGQDRLAAGAVADPVGRSQAVFDDVAYEIARSVDRLAAALGVADLATGAGSHA
jgi:protein-tyrosine-phosphatase